jgi:DNA invertase Pin-like site-specific DNA recombinase
MANGDFISYLRVSTRQQGDSGLGIAAQRDAVSRFLNGGEWRLLAEYVEVESGRNNARPKLAEALAMCRLTGATLLCAKLDRLSRNAAFLLNLRDSGVKFVAVDNPHVDEMTVGILAVVAEAEAKAISRRTIDALRSARQRGQKLGGTYRFSRADQEKGLQLGTLRRSENARRFRAEIQPHVVQALAEAGSLSGAASILNARGIRTSRAKSWTAMQVRRIMEGAATSAIS